MIDNRYNDRYIVDTPENIEFGYDVAGIGVRFLAALVDHGIFVAVMYIVFLLMDRADVSMAAYRIFITTSTLLMCAYYIAFERFWNGQTPGKRIFGLRVVQDAGRPVTLLASVIRNLIRIIDFFPVLYGLAIVSMFIDQRIRRMGDLAAGTLVVRDRQRVTLQSLMAGMRTGRVASALASNSKAVLPNIEALRPNDMALVQDFLMRRASLPLDRRSRIAGQLAYALFGRLGYSVPGDPELFLQQVSDQYVLVQGQALSGQG
jgi:uncharacterized RDD family membrane protein YckC